MKNQNNFLQHKIGVAKKLFIKTRISIYSGQQGYNVYKQAVE
jgi:hypothetical protein